MCVDDLDGQCYVYCGDVGGLVVGGFVEYQVVFGVGFFDEIVEGVYLKLVQGVGVQ